MDSDGDSVFGFNVSSRGVDVARGLEMNNHFMGMRGYTYAYGNEPSGWPCAEFSSYKDKWGKKAIVVPQGTAKSYVTRKDASWYIGAAERVANHYTGAVGISYGICSVLTFQAAELKYQLEAGNNNVANVYKLYERTLAIVWRLLYEGLGLAGYSADAKMYFDILSIATWKNEYMLVDGVATRVAVGTPKEKCLPCVPKLIELMGLSHLKVEIATEIIKLILAAEKIRQNRGALERGKDRVANLSQHEVDNTAIYTGLRAIGQGKDVGGNNALASNDGDFSSDDVQPQSLFNLVLNNKLTNRMSCDWLAELLQTGSEIHKTVTTLVFNAKQIEDESM